MKTLRKNIDLANNTIAILQIESTLAGYGSLKPFLEKIINDFAAKSAKGKPEVYKNVVNQKAKKIESKKKPKKLLMYRGK
jgi:hypothetical protein